MARVIPFPTIEARRLEALEMIQSPDQYTRSTGWDFLQQHGVTGPDRAANPNRWKPKPMVFSGFPSDTEPA